MSESVSLAERQALGRCLHTMLFLVSGADGEATAREGDAIEAALRELDARLGEGHLGDLDVSVPSLRQAGRASEGLGFHLHGAEVEAARRALERMPAAERERYEAYMIEACVRVAEASAEYWGLGPRINEDERLLLRDIVGRLGLRVRGAEAREKLGLETG